MRASYRGLIWSGLISLLLALGSPISMAESRSVEEQVSQVLDLLSVSAIVQQSISSAELVAQSRAVADLDHKEIEANFDSERLLTELSEYLVERYQPEAFGEAIRVLSLPSLQRLREFDYVLKDQGNAEKLAEYRQQLSNRPPIKSRYDQVSQLVEISRQGELAAEFQGWVERRLTQWQQLPVDSAEQQKKNLELRRQHINKILTEIGLYNYRYLKSSELETCVSLMRDPNIQWLLEVILQGMRSQSEPASE